MYLKSHRTEVTDEESSAFQLNSLRGTLWNSCSTIFFLKKTPKTWEISLVLKIFRENQPHIHYICAQSLSINCSAKPIVLVNFEIWISTFCAKTNLFAIYSQNLDRLWNSTEKLINTSSEPIEIEFSSSACISQEASEVSVRIKFAIECVPGRRAYVTFITNRFSFRNQYFISITSTKKL